MTDRERVISNFEHEVSKAHGEGWDFVDLSIEDAKEILALLKERESVEPVFDAGDGKTIGQFLCGKCHVKIGLGHPHFCWYCGQAVKWDE